MSARALERVVWGFAVVCALGAAVVWWKAEPDIHVRPPPPIGRLRPITTFEAESLSLASRTVVESDPFRISRIPPRPPTATTTETKPSPPPRPTLRISGIVGGPPWAAIIDGIPGQVVPAVASAGEVYGTLRIRVVGPDSVVVAGEDTTWVLRLDVPWR